MFVCLFFSFPQKHSSSVFITVSLRLVGGKKYSRYHQPPSHFQYSITFMNMVHNIQYHQQWSKKEKYIEKMYPSESRALKYVTCKGKDGCSIIPKRGAEKWELLQRPDPNILPTILPRAPIILCRRDYMCNRKGRSQITGHFSKQIPTPTHRQHKKNNKPNPGPSLPPQPNI